MILDRRMDVADVKGDGETPREGVEIGEIDLALPRELELTL